MSESASIGIEQVRELMEWLNRQSVEGAGSGNSVEAWCEARQVDLVAVAAAASSQSALTLAELAEQKMGLPMALECTFLAGFQVGLDAERRRRDAAELPG